MAMFMITDHQQTKNDGYFVKMTSGGNTNLYVSLVQCMILIFFSILLCFIEVVAINLTTVRHVF